VPHKRESAKVQEYWGPDFRAWRNKKLYSSVSWFWSFSTSFLKGYVLYKKSVDLLRYPLSTKVFMGAANDWVAGVDGGWFNLGGVVRDMFPEI
jgi:hypothetical protein